METCHINEKENRQEPYNTKKDWAEQTNQAAQNPTKVKEMEVKLDDWVLTLPKNSPASCFSVEIKK